MAQKKERDIKNYILNSKNPGALYSLHRLKQVPNLNFDKDALLKVYEENDTLRQFYNRSKISKKRTTRNAYANYPLERIHIDLCEMTNEKHGESDFRYILFAVDNYSRYVFYVFLKSKKAEEMEAAAKSLLSQMKPFRNLSMNQSSLFMADLGTEFITKFKKHLESEGHFFQNLASSESKAFYAERFIRTYRELLKVKRTDADLKQLKKDDWVSLTPDVIEIYNVTPHSSLKFHSPIEYINLEKASVQSENSKRKSLSKQDFLKTIKSAPSNVDVDANEVEVTNVKTVKTKFSVGDYVRITKTKRNVFAKGSETPNISLEIFKVYKVRLPLLDSSKLPLYFLKDMTDKTIAGGFREDELVFIRPTSKHHPLNQHFVKSIRSVIATIQPKGKSKDESFKVNFNGE
jgi:hypothetical protein